MKLLKPLLISIVLLSLFLIWMTDSALELAELNAEGYHVDVNREEGSILEKPILFDGDGEPTDFLTNVEIGWMLGAVILTPIFFLLFGAAYRKK